MKLLENLKLESWYGIMFYVGLLMIGASLYLKVDFIEMKHLFGFGLGLVILGFSFIIAEKHRHEINSGLMISTKVIIHSPISWILMIIGICLIFLFLFLIIKKLI